MNLKALVLFVLLFSFIGCNEQKEQFTTVWPEIKTKNKPWTRWWWMGNAVSKPEIDRQLTDLANAGFGGVEITPIYGAKGFEDQYVDFLSDEWMDILQFTIEKADELGMGVDMNLGTGWPFGGPQITPEYAASRLVMQHYNLKSGEKLNEKIAIDDSRQNPEDVELLALVAYFADGKVENLTNKINDSSMVEWVPEHDVEVVAAFNAKTRQKVKRAAPGGEGWSMDHFSHDALAVYLNRFDEAFGKIKKRPRAFFNDSFEVYGSSSTKNIIEEFEVRKRYDIRQYLRELGSEEDTQDNRRIQSDYREVFGDLLLKEFTIPWANWSASKNVMARNQAHGSPGNIIDLYGAVDIPECETFGSSYFPIPGLRRDSADIRNVDPDPVMQKFATSAANVLGKAYASSETFTWLAEHFKVSLSQCKPELEQVFLAGVNHVFYHGTTYSPEVAGWPGWLFYASVQFGPVNSFWQHVLGLNEYIARTQSILQAGHADNDALVYWPIYDIWNDTGRLDMQISIHNIDEWLHPTPFYQISKALMDKGYLLDFVSDKIIENLQVQEGQVSANREGGSYKSLIIPSCEFMPIATLENIMRIAEDGAEVIFQELPKDVPGFHDLENRRKKFQELLSSIEFVNNQAKIGQGKIILDANVSDLDFNGESLVQTGLKFVRRIIDGERYYYLVNHTPGTIDQEIKLNAKTSAAVFMDPDHGRFGRVATKVENSQSGIRVQLASGQSVIIRCTDMDVSNLTEWKFIGQTEATIPLDGAWQLSFVQGGPALPDRIELSELTSWTETGNEKAVNFSGTGVYEYTLALDSELADEYILDLGKVAESAKVFVNDEEVGVLWSFPFNIRIGKYLKKGDNAIKIEVANLMANRIRYMDQLGIEWRNYHEINFVNIDYKPFNASVWEPMPSGLLGPVVVEAINLE